MYILCIYNNVTTYVPALVARDDNAVFWIPLFVPLEEPPFNDIMAPMRFCFRNDDDDDDVVVLVVVVAAAAANRL